jgi:hypothetical protein
MKIAVMDIIACSIRLCIGNKNLNSFTSIASSNVASTVTKTFEIYFADYSYIF